MVHMIKIFKYDKQNDRTVLNQSNHSVQERIILHLDRYNVFREHFLIPQHITQTGIARAVGIARNHVPRAMGPLKEGRIVLEKKARVEGSDRRKNVYFLTEKGLESVKNLRVELDIKSSRFLDIPKATGFVGRGEEINTVRKFLKSGKKIIFITGERGIGKTYFASRIANELARKNNVYWHTFSDTETVYSFLRNLSSFLSMRGNGLLGYRLGSSSELRAETAVDVLTEVLEDMVLVLDDADVACKEIRELLSGICHNIDKFTELRLFVAGRDLTELARLPKNRKSAFIALEGLDEESVRQLLKDKGFVDDKEMFELIRDHPLFLRIIRSESAPGDIHDYLERDIWNGLSHPEKKVMDILSTHSRPVRLDLLFMESGIDYQDVRNLAEKGLVQEVGVQVFDTHKILKEFFYSRIPGGKRKSLHMKIAKKFLKEENPVYWLEAQRHMLKAGKQKDCAKVVLDTGLELIRKGLKGDLEEIISEINETDMDEVTWAEILLIRGYLWKLKGKWEEALRDYGNALGIFEKARMNEKQADAISKIGRIYLERGDFGKATEEFEKALSLLDDRDNSVTARIFDELATIHLRKGDVEKAGDLVGRALEIAENIPDWEMVGRINNTFGNLHVTAENWKDAERSYQRCLELLKGEDDQMAVIVLNNIAIVSYKMGELQNALSRWEEAAEKAEKIESLNVMLTFSNLGFINYSTGNWEKAIHYCKKALEISEHVGKDVITAASRSILGHVALHRGEEMWQEHYETALKAREKLGDKKGQASSHNDLAAAFLINDEIHKAMAHADKARALSEETDNKEQMIRANLNLAKIAVKNGNTDGSKEHLKVALATAKEAGDKVLQGHVYRDIGHVSAIEGEDFVAERYIKESVDILEKENVPIELGQSLHEYGRVIERGKLGDSEEYLRRSKEIFRSLGMPDVPPVVDVW